MVPYGGANVCRSKYDLFATYNYPVDTEILGKHYRDVVFDAKKTHALQTAGVSRPRKNPGSPTTSEMAPSLDAAVHQTKLNNPRLRSHAVTCKVYM